MMTMMMMFLPDQKRLCDSRASVTRAAGRCQLEDCVRSD